MTNDVEKRFNQPRAFRAAAIYMSAVVAVAGVAFAVFAFAARDSVFAAALVPAILFAGGVGALITAYRIWKVRGRWFAWQGAGWFLLLLMLVTLAIPGSAFMFGGVQ